MTQSQMSASALRRLTSQALRIPDAVLLVAIGSVAALMLLRFIAFFPLARGEFGYAAWVADDFFYYAVVAQSIVETGRSTFDGVSLTNGYHPLWMVICVGLAAIFGTKSAGFFIAIFLIQTALIVAGVVTFAALMRRAGKAGVITTGGQMIATSIYGVALALTGADGMEITLLAPLTPLLMLAAWELCERPTLKQAFIVCGLLCATILSRLDMVIVFAPLGLGVAILVTRRFGVKTLLQLTPAAIALIPLALYLIYNIITFGDAMPISGQAKRLMTEGAPFGFSMVALASFVTWSNANDLLSPFAVTVLTAWGVLVAAAAKNIRSTITGAGYLLLVAGATLFYLQAAATSDWMLWPWYFFPVILTGAIGTGLAIDAALRVMPHTWLEAKRWAAPVLCLALLAAGLKANGWQLQQPPSVNNALFTRVFPILDFVRSHPGRYAVGDGGGAVGFILPGGVVQLEGLVNDKTFLDEIKREGTIDASLKRQGVDYYITSGKLAPLDGCVELTEPKQGGQRVARMRQKACEQPALDLQTSWLETHIWDVRDGLN